MPQTQVRTSPVEGPAPGSRGGGTSGGAAPGPKTRGTVVEAEAALQTGVAAEAEAGEARSPVPVREGKGGEEKKVIISNAFSLSMLGEATNVRINIRSATIEEVRNLLLAGGFDSAVGHEATATLLTKLLGVEVKVERKTITLTPCTKLVVFQLLSRLPEGKVLTEDELMKVDYKFFTVEVVEEVVEG